MKKTLLTITMGMMVFSLSQTATAEASFSLNEPASKINNSWLVQTQQSPLVLKIEAEKFNGIDQVFAKYMSLIPTVQKAVAEKTVVQKPVVQKPVAQKPVAEKPVAQKSVSEKTATQKPVTQKPVTETPATQKPVTQNPAPSQPATPATQKPSTTETSISSIEQQVLTLTNQERAKAGLSPLAADAPLMASARAKSSDMSTNNYFSHNSPTLGSPFDQMKARGINYRAAAENIAMGQRTAQEVVTGWMNSPGHRENIMNANYTHIGIGYDANGHYWTQQFIQK